MKQFLNIPVSEEEGKNPLSGVYKVLPTVVNVMANTINILNLFPKTIATLGKGTAVHATNMYEQTPDLLKIPGFVVCPILGYLRSHIDVFGDDLQRIRSQFLSPETNIQLPEDLKNPDSPVYKYNPILWALNFIGKIGEIASIPGEIASNSLQAQANKML